MKRLKKGNVFIQTISIYIFIYLDQHFQIVYSFISFHFIVFFNVFDIAIKLSFEVYLAYEFKLALHLSLRLVYDIMYD